MAERRGALAGHRRPGLVGTPGDVGVTLQALPGLILYQIAAWPGTLATVGAHGAAAAGADQVPGPGRATQGRQRTALLRIEPLKWWLVGGAADPLPADQGSVLDLSHSRTHIALSGPHAAALLNRHLPLDLRDETFGPGRVASSAFHHVGVTVWHSGDAYHVLIPRGFALSLWEMLLASAAQFGAEVV